MSKVSVHLNEGAIPWWLTPGGVDWENVGRHVDFYLLVQSLEFRCSVMACAGVSWWTAAQWTALSSVGWWLAAKVGWPLPWWALACAVFGPWAAKVCAIEVARVAIGFAAESAKMEAARAVKTWGAAMAAAAPGDSLGKVLERALRGSPSARAVRASSSAYLLSRHTLGMVLNSLSMDRWSDEGASFSSSLNPREFRWMPARRLAYRLVEPLTRSTNASRQCAKIRDNARVELAGEAGLAMGRELFPRAYALSEGREIGTGCRVAPGAARSARL